MSKNPNWTNEELKILYDFYEDKDREFIEKLLPNRNWQGIQIKAARLKLYRLNYFTEDDLKFIKENYMTMSSPKIGKILNRHRGNIESKAREMGFIKQEKWGEKDVEILKDNFGKFTVKEISKNFLPNRTLSSIYHMVQTLNLQEKTNRYFDTTNEELIEKMKFICYKLGRTITSKELTYFDMPCAPLFVKRFGSYSKFCELCGLQANTGYVKASKLIDKRGEKCLSNAEKLISDFLFDNNFTYKKETPYKNFINSHKTKMRCDWFLNNEIVVEFFGMARHKKYKERMIKKINLCKENKIVLIEIYEKDLISDSYKEKLLPFL